MVALNLLRKEDRSLGQRMRTLRPGTDQLLWDASQIVDEHPMIKLVTVPWHREPPCATKKG